MYTVIDFFEINHKININTDKLNAAEDPLQDSFSN